MKYLFNYWRKLERKLAKGRLVLFLDFDGTLSPIAPTPAQARLSLQTKRMLKELSRKLQGRMAIVSGRALRNLKRKVGVAGLIYVGNHGLEIEGKDFRFTAPGARSAVGLLRRLKAQLRRQLSGVAGVLLEDKALTVSLHYRKLKPSLRPHVRRLVERIVGPYILEKKVVLRPGKMVFEIRPNIDWHKGRAVIWLMRRLGRGRRLVACYIGDDTTDEDAFEMLQGRGLSVVVGRRRSRAAYYLKGQREVNRLLQKLISLNY